MLLDGFDYILEKIPYFAQSVAYVGNGREAGRVFEGKKGVRVVIEGLGHAIGGGKGSKDVKTAIVLGGRGEVESAGAVSCPRFPVLWRIVGND